MSSNTSPSLPRIAFCAFVFTSTMLQASDEATSSQSPNPADIAHARKLLEANKYAQILDTLSQHDHSDNIDVLTLLGDAHFHLNQLRKARGCYARILGLRADSEYARLRLGQVYVKEGKYGLAVEQLTTAENLGVSNTDIHRSLAEAYFNLHVSLGKTVEVDAPGRTAREFFNGLYLIEQTGKRRNHFLASPPESAIYQLSMASAMGASDAPTRLLEAEVWLMSRRYEYAAQACQSLYDDPDGKNLSEGERARFHYCWAKALWSLDEVEAFLDQTRKAATISPELYASEMGKAYENAAARYNQRGDLLQYIKYMELATLENYQSAKLHYRLGNGYWETGNRIKATQQWQITLQLEPDHPDRERMLGAIEQTSAAGRH